MNVENLHFKGKMSLVYITFYMLLVFFPNSDVKLKKVICLIITSSQLDKALFIWLLLL